MELAVPSGPERFRPGAIREMGRTYSVADAANELDVDGGDYVLAEVSILVAAPFLLRRIAELTETPDD